MRFVFPRWTNALPTALAIATPIAAIGLIAAVAYWFSPEYTDVGYRPVQPVAYSHRLHAGQLGIDCRYCHTTVERAWHAAIPPTATCINCHKYVKADEPSLAKVRESAETGNPIPWVRVHQLPDYAYFPHLAHVNAGVGCVSCHGRVDKMERVRLWAPLSMGWCLECHRNPKPYLRPVSEVTNMSWNRREANYDPDQDPLRTRKVEPPQHCSGCHR